MLRCLVRIKLMCLFTLKTICENFAIWKSTITTLTINKAPQQLCLEKQIIKWMFGSLAICQANFNHGHCQARLNFLRRTIRLAIASQHSILNNCALEQHYNILTFAEQQPVLW